MSNIGIISNFSPSHLNPVLALGIELQKRKHKVTIFNIPDFDKKVLAVGLEFYPIGETEYPKGWVQEFSKKINSLSGIATGQYLAKNVLRESAMIFRELPNALKKASIDLLIVDQDQAAGGTVAEFLNIPFITFCSALAANREPAIPPSFTPWPYQNTWSARLRNQMMYAFYDFLSRPIAKLFAQQRRDWKLPTHGIFDDTFSRLAQICQQPPLFDFPRQSLPKWFHYTGLLRTSATESVPFPFDRLTEKPLIYASLGTLHNKRPEIFQYIAQACVGLDAQLIISLGGGSSIEDYQQLPGEPLVVEYAPQLELLAKAKLTITHAGLNTVLESLHYGVPMVAIPIATDQFGIGARLNWTKAGEVIQLSELKSADRLRIEVQNVLKDDYYRSNAERVRESSLKAGGVMRVADIVEQVLITGKPVLRPST